MAKRNKQGAVGEQIIITQSVLITAFSLACYMASKSINDAWLAIQDKDSMVAIATDSAIMTDKVTVDLDFTRSIVMNFEFVCLTVLCVGIGIGVATLLRILKRN